MRRPPALLALSCLASGAPLACQSQPSSPAADAASTTREASREPADADAAAKPATSAAPLEGLRVIELPDGPGASAPSLGRGAERLHLVWMQEGQGSALNFASLPTGPSADPAGIPAADAWGEAQLVLAKPELFINWADVPVVGETLGGRVVVAWPEWHSEDPAQGYGLRVAVQLEDGSFGPSWSPDDNSAGPESGFSSFISTPEGLRMVWLDGRALSDEGAHGGGGEGETMQLRTLLIDEQGAQAGPSELLDARTCECCKLDLGLVDGQAFAAYRDRSEAEIRDIYVAGPGLPTARLAQDDWEIAGCPVNGPSVASDGTRATIAWFTGAGGQSALQVASGSPRAGFGPGQRFDLGEPAGRVDAIATPGGGALLSWLELDPATPGEGRLLTRTIDAQGSLGEAREVTRMGMGRDWGFPRAALIGDEVLWVISDPGDEQRPARLRGEIGPLPRPS